MNRVPLILIALLLTSCTSNELPEPAVEATSPTTTPETPDREPPWDPRDVDDLPHAPKDVAPALPAVIDPPADVALLETNPMDAAVLSVKRRDGRIQMLGVDGSWREIRSPEKYPREALSPDGTRLVMLLADSLEIWHLPTGDRTTLPLPAGYVPWDFSWVGWIDESTLLLDDYRGGWRIDVTSGAAERTPYPRWANSWWEVDGEGAVLEVADPSDPPALLDWSTGSPRRVELPGLGHLQPAAVRGDTVIGTTYDERGFAVIAFDRSDPATSEWRLPVRDFEGNYSNWAMRTLDVLDDGSGLLWVAVPSRKSEVDGWRIVRWDPSSDRLEVVTSSESDPTWPLTFARDVLG